MRKDAELHADEDAKKREAVDTRNQAEQAVYQTEKMLKENGDKVSDAKKKPVEDAIAALKEALKGDDTAAIKAKQEALMQAMQGAAEELYSKAGPQGAPGAGPQPGPQPGVGNGSSKKGDDGVVDADFEEVK